MRSGDRLQVAAEGTITLSGNNNSGDTASPAGSHSGRRAANAPVPSAPAGALIARIDNGAPFVLADRQGSVRISQTGRLFIGVNDDHLTDNNGEFRVTISVDR
jgi:hypothetical protein